MQQSSVTILPEENAFFYFFSIPPNKTVRSVAEFIDVVQQRRDDKSIDVSYRGLSDIDYDLKPSLYRNKGFRHSESTMMRSLFASQPEDFASDSSTLERLVRFQHFSLPTRLMDVTWNPLVALYFAVKDTPEHAGKVIAIASQSRETKFFDSDRVSLLANLCYLSGRERNTLKRNREKSERVFNELPEAKRLVSFVKTEKPYFENKIKPADLLQPTLVRPKLNNKRIAAQNGAFVVFGMGFGLALNDYDAFEIASIKIEAVHKIQIGRELDRLGFNDQSMFPELEMAAKYVRAKYFIPLKK